MINKSNGLKLPSHSGIFMLNDRDEIAFYIVSGVAFSLAFWAFGFFKLHAFPMTVPLLLSCFFANLLLSTIGEKMLGPESKATQVKIVFICAVGAFFLSWAANLGSDALGSFALPASIMFFLPSALYYIRQAVLRSESNVQA